MVPLLVIAGPTGVGKTSIAIEIAERLDGEIVGADSRQVYRYMNIGTAKPTPEERARIPHHLIDFRDPDEEYSAAEYARDASTVIADIYARGKFPLLVGGTGLYIQAVIYGIFEGPGRDEEFRAKMRELAEQHGTAYVHQKLAQVDPTTAQRLHPNDLVRIIRALEVYHLTGRSISEHQACHTQPLAQYYPYFLILNAQRSLLYARINARVDQMIAQGLIEEVEELHRRGYHQDLFPMNSVGYKEIFAFLAGDCDRETAIERIKRNTRHYAKRQLTWFRKYRNACWISFDRPEQFGETVRHCWQAVEPWKKSIQKLECQ